MIVLKMQNVEEVNKRQLGVKSFCSFGDETKIEESELIYGGQAKLCTKQVYFLNKFF